MTHTLCGHAVVLERVLIDGEVPLTEMVPVCPQCQVRVPPTELGPDTNMLNAKPVPHHTETRAITTVPVSD